MNIQIMEDTNPLQVCVTYPDGKMEVMLKSEWDERNKED